MKLSVTLANYNHAHFLRTCLDGILSQTYGDLELIVTDDGSTDGSRDIFEEYRGRDRRVIVEYLPKNEGAMRAFQRCYARITGDLMYATASDDYLSEPRFFEMVVQLLTAYPQAAGVFARQRVVWNDTGELVDVTGISPINGFVAPEICLEAYLLGRLLACGLSSVWRMPCVRAVGGYPAELGPYSELYVNHALPALHGAVFLPAAVGVARIPHDSSSYSEAMDIEVKARACARLEGMLRRLEPARTLDPELFLAFRRRTINGSIVERRLNDQSLREMQKLMTTHLTYCRARVLRDAWLPVQQAVRDVAALTEREVARVLAIFEEETGVGMATADRDTFDDVISRVDQEIPERILWSLYQHMSWIRGRAASGAPFRVAVFGAGGHTRELLHVWRMLSLPDWTTVIVTGSPASVDFEGIPVAAASDVAAGHLDMIVVSSRSYEPEMVMTCMRRFPEVPRLTIWNPDMSTIARGGVHPTENTPGIQGQLREATG